MRAENPSLTLAGTRLPFQFPLDPAERILYGTRTNVEGRFLYGDTLHGGCQIAIGLSPYHGESPVFAGAAGTPHGHQHQLWALFEAMD
eukprot:1286682-Pleurochrysis_carterae.AAC.1